LSNLWKSPNQEHQSISNPCSVRPRFSRKLRNTTLL
jgi:hypothetical protein